jgi:TRAP-type C4-dicarboxylate transport system permease small subunit
MQRLNDLLILFCKITIMIMVPVMTMVIFVQVLLRYVFLSPLGWAEELSRYLMVWISCLGAAYATRSGMHVSIVFLKNRFPEHIRSGVTLMTHLSLILFFLVCTVKGFSTSFSEWYQNSAAMEIPMTFPLLSVPVSFSIMTLFSIELLMRDTREIMSTKRPPVSLGKHP